MLSWYRLKSFLHHCPCHTALSPVSRGILLHARCVLYTREWRNKENAFPQSGFYFLHQHFKTGRQISWRRGDSEGANAGPYMGIGQGDRQNAEVCSHAHTHIFTRPRVHISNIIQHMGRASTHITTGMQITSYALIF